MIVLAKSKLEVSNVAKMALNGLPKRTFISPDWCPKIFGHIKCGMNRSMGISTGVCSTEGFIKFQVTCKNCREEIATVYAKDKTLLDWRRLRYTSWHDKQYWYGLRGLNINPKTNHLLLECSCEPEVRKTPNEFTIKEIK